MVQDFQEYEDISNFKASMSSLEKKPSIWEARCHRNISREEQKALENLRNYDDIVIKQADKGSAVVILDRDKNVAEAMRQLNDSEVYISLRDDPTADMIRKVNERVEKLHNDGYISQSTLQYLMVTNDATAGRFYLLPKIHKKNCPGRSVISGCNTPTEKISAFLDSQLKPLVSQIPSFVKDNNHFLNKLKAMGKFPDGAILATIDDEGLTAVRKALNNRCDSEIPTNDIVDLVELVLKNNNFEFAGKHYLQKRGTAIGTRMAPSYANLFMHDLESKLLAWVPVKPFIWLRYIDDIFMVWTEGEEKLLEFLKNINNFHDTIKFTFDWSRDLIHYLDVQVINNGGVIETDLYTKPTDKHQYLYHTSCHPKGCKRSIPYSQALRLKRICST
ncbi:uncharacterized protein LOC122949770 [Acropora millepora]|uniref:uncharacterized protein LOC122949770 n=1 Tax=Acropora millepora TaxID=45264 RepID=UPI001CF307E6|nr:uncharacterized protein LOC122949770 [Acropora millepora]